VIWYLLGSLYAVAALASSVVFAAALQERTSAANLSDLDRQDLIVFAICTVVWPLPWLAAGWIYALKSYRRHRTERMLSSLGATYEPKEPATDD
jgi:hypothetical protein